MKKHAWVPLILLAAAGACSGGETENSASAPDNAAVAPTPVSEATDTGISLSEDGLRIAEAGPRPAVRLQFGTTSRAEVVSALSPALGQPSRTARNEDCPTGAVDVVSFGSLDLHFADGKFAGWVLDGDRPELQTSEGLKVGSARKEIEGGQADEASTLGTEIVISGIGAILDGPGADARVTTLFSGTTCFAR